jgi:hypothetical protein
VGLTEGTEKRYQDEGNEKEIAKKKELVMAQSMRASGPHVHFSQEKKKGYLPGIGSFASYRISIKPCF